MKGQPTMKPLERIGRGLACGMLGVCAALGCAPARPPLPPAPPPVSAEQLAPWAHPPPLAPEEHASGLELQIQRAKLPNGVGVTLAVTEGAATSVQLWLPNARDRGLGAVTAMVNALRAGTRDGTKAPFYNPKIALAPISAWTDAVGTTFYWRVPQRGTQQALSLLGAYVRDPLFDPDDVQLRLQQQVAAIKFASEPLNQLQPLARGAFRGLERPTYEQDARQMFHLPPQKLQQIHRCTMQPANAELVVVGPVAFESVVAWATSAFGSWRADPAATAEACADWLTPAFPEHPEQARLDRPLLIVISGMRGDPRIAMDVPGPPIDSPDYHPFELLSMLLEEHAGGSAKALRHAGATYGIHASTYDRYARLSLLEVSGQIDPEQLQGALRSLLDDIHGLANRLDAAELDAAKRRWRTQLIDSWQRSDALAGALQWTLRSGHEPADILQVFDEVQQIDLARFREVAERYLSPANPSITITGYAPNLTRGLALGAEVREVRWTDKLQEHEKLNR